MRIVLLIEGNTEKAFLSTLRKFFGPRLARMPRLDPDPYNGRLQKGDKLKKEVERHLRTGADAVIALTDVYTGSTDFESAADAKQKMRTWVGHPDRPHAAQYEFEAWLLPYWDAIRKLAVHTSGGPRGKPELVSHNKAPSVWLTEIFETGKSGRSYSKVRDAARILRDNDLTIAANACPELKAFLNTILRLWDGDCLE